jgi:uncharacterized protein (DUF924 family)
MDPRAQDVVAFWRDAGPEKWFSKDDAFDAEFRRRFEALHFAAARRDLDDWMNEPDGVLALMILLDQLPRNCFRGTAHMYATDPLALSLARRAIDAGTHETVDEQLRVFLYLPLMHSEALADQEHSVRLCAPLEGDYVKHADGHRDIIVRFGRFPHRNRMLGRDSTPEEQVFLDEGGFSG